jgi:hypothetical protein
MVIVCYLKYSIHHGLKTLQISYTQILRQCALDKPQSASDKP